MELSKRTIKFPLDNGTTLLLNATSGAIDIIPDKTLKKPSSETTQILKDRGYLQKEEYTNNTIRKLAKTSKEHNKNIPYWFYILTTLHCNYNCPICYEKNTTKTSNLTKETLQGIIKTLKIIQKEKKIPAKKMFIVLFGGEPLCGDKNVVENIFKEIKKQNWKIIIVTNGSLIRKYLYLFKKYKSIISDFRITLDGSREIHNKRRPLKNNLESFPIVEKAIDSLLKEGFTVKMQTILGDGNEDNLDELVQFLLIKNWFKKENYQWRIEGSHDYANLDPEKDEISEGKMVVTIINLICKYPGIAKKIKFESFKYLSHIVNSFGWMGNYKTYWGPKFGFCEPQKGFHFVFSTDGKIFHCPRTINNSKYLIGATEKGLNSKEVKYKNSTILDKNKCKTCNINTLCGGGCAVQKIYYKNFNCQQYALKIINEFLSLMKVKIASESSQKKIISINKLWADY